MPPHASSSDPASMSLGDHLDELRRRVFYAIAAPLPISIVAFFFSAQLIDLLLRPLYRALESNDLPVQVQVLSPPEFLLTQLKLSIIVAIIISGPWILWQAWLFIGPGLYRHERRFVYFLIPGSAVLTTAGVLLFYFVMLPLVLQVLIMFGSSLREPVDTVRIDAGPAAIVEEMVEASDKGHAQIRIVTETPVQAEAGDVWLKMPENVLHLAVPSATGGEDALDILRLPMGAASRVAQQFRLSETIGFILMFLLAISIAFQLPLVILLLGWLGLVTVPWLRANRRYALFLFAIVSMFTTPADLVSMILMLIPLYGLYELGILLLVFAPASRVAAGRVLFRRGASGEPGPGTSAGTSDSPDDVSQTEQPFRPPDEHHGGGNDDADSSDDRSGRS